MNKKIYILSAFIILLTILGTLWYAHYQPSKYRLSSPQYASNQPSETAESIKESEDFTNATENKEKEPETLFSLADKYYHGKDGYAQDYEKAFELFSKSAKEVEDDYCSNTVLANMYYDGKGTQKDVKKALELWGRYRDGCRATEKTVSYSVEAYNKIKNYLIETKDKEFAFSHGDACFERFRSSFDCGHATSLKDTEEENPNNVCEQGEEWYKLAAEFGHPEAKVRLAVNYLLPLNWHHNCYQDFHSEYHPKNNEEYRHDGEKLLISAAEQGYVDAMEELGLMYFYGWLPEDQKKAEKWFLKAAEKGEGYSALMLARLYYGGKDSVIPADYQKVHYWANQAIKNGEGIGHYYLGLLYYYGLGVLKDHKKALFHFKKERNNYEWLLAGMMLQKMYLNGEGTAEDFKELEDTSGRCYYYYCTKGWIFGKENYATAEHKVLWKAAVEKNDILAQIHLIKISRDSSNEIDENLSEVSQALIALQNEPKDEYAKKEWVTVRNAILEEQKLLKPITDYDTADMSALKQNAIFKNDTLAQRRLGAYYIRNSKNKEYEIEKLNLTKAIEWYFLAAYAGDPIAQVQLASMYGRRELGTYQSYYDPNTVPEEIYWLEKAAEQGNPMAKYELGNKYYYGVAFYDEQGAIATQGLNIPYLARNLEKAFNLYMESAQAGYVPAMKRVSYMYEHGEHVNVDHQEKEYWEKKAEKTNGATTFDDEVNFYTELHQKQ